MQVLTEELEKHLEERCDIISHFCGWSDKPMDEVIQALTQAREVIQTCEERCRQEGMRSISTLFNLIQTMMATLSVLWDILFDYKCKTEFERNATYDAYYSVICRNFYLKLRVLRLQLIVEFYDDETAQALLKMRFGRCRKNTDLRVVISFTQN